MTASIHRSLLLLTGAALVFIGVTYCIDPNLLLARYDLVVSNASEDNIYRGAYGGLFIAVGAAIAYGFFAPSFRQVATLVAALFMGGFALGRLSSLFMVGMPHDLIVALLGLEVVSTVVFAGFFYTQSKAVADGVMRAA